MTNPIRGLSIYTQLEHKEPLYRFIKITMTMFKGQTKANVRIWLYCVCFLTKLNEILEQMAEWPRKKKYERYIGNLRMLSLNMNEINVDISLWLSG